MVYYVGVGQAAAIRALSGASSIERFVNGDRLVFPEQGAKKHPTARLPATAAKA